MTFDMEFYVSKTNNSKLIKLKVRHNKQWGNATNEI